jgi:hypothetical protein
MKIARNRRHVSLVPPSPEAEPQVESRPAPVPGVALARVLGRAGAAWRVHMAGGEQTVAADPAIDPALLDEAARSGARVVLELGPAPAIAGVLQTARAIAIGRDGSVDISVKRLAVTVAEEALLKSAGAFLKVGPQELELYGNRLVSRARELYRVLGRMVKIN